MRTRDKLKLVKWCRDTAKLYRERHLDVRWNNNPNCYGPEGICTVMTSSRPCSFLNQFKEYDRYREVSNPLRVAINDLPDQDAAGYKFTRDGELAWDMRADFLEYFADNLELEVKK